MAVGYVQNLNIAYFKNLPRRTHVTYQKQILHAYPTYVLLIGWYALNVPYVKGAVHRSTKALNAPYLKGTVRR